MLHRESGSAYFQHDLVFGRPLSTVMAVTAGGRCNGESMRSTTNPCHLRDGPKTDLGRRRHFLPRNCFCIQFSKNGLPTATVRQIVGNRKPDFAITPQAHIALAPQSVSSNPAHGGRLHKIWLTILNQMFAEVTSARTVGVMPGCILHPLNKPDRCQSSIGAQKERLRSF